MYNEDDVDQKYQFRYNYPQYCIAKYQKSSVRVLVSDFEGCSARIEVRFRASSSLCMVFLPTSSSAGLQVRSFRLDYCSTAMLYIEVVTLVVVMSLYWIGYIVLF